MQIPDSVNAAIRTFNKCLSICQVVGAEAAGVKNTIEPLMPALYDQSATMLFKANKPDEAIAGFLLSAEMAKKYNNPKLEAKAKNMVLQLYISQGNNFLKTNDQSKAMDYYDRAIAFDPSAAKAYFGKGLILKQQDKPGEFEAIMRKTISYGIEANDEKTVIKAREIARAYFGNKGVAGINNKMYDEAINQFRLAISFDTTYDEAYFGMAVAYNELQQWDNAVIMAQKAVYFKVGSDDEKAKIYFELGRAYQGLNDYGNACDAYKNALYGKFQKAAELQRMNVLKCSDVAEPTLPTQ